VALGGVAVVALLLVLPRPLNAANVKPPVLPAAIIGIGLPLLAWLYASMWRLRIDHIGLWRCRLGTCSCWTWEYLSSGAVTLDRHHGFLWGKGRPWHDRLLGFGLVEPADASFVLGVLDRVFPNREQEEAVATAAGTGCVTLRMMKWQRLDIDGAGVKVQKGWTTFEYTWDDIMEFRVERIRQQQQAVAHRIELRPIEGDAFRGDVLFVWTDGRWQSRANVKFAPWIAAIERIVPKAKWKCFQTWGDASSREALLFRIEHWQAQATSARKMLWLLVPVMVVLPIVAFGPKMLLLWNDPLLPLLWKVIGCGCLMLTMFMPAFIALLVLRHVVALHRAQLKACQQQLAEFTEITSPSQSLPDTSISSLPLVAHRAGAPESLMAVKSRAL
jgi:hypothetical protein